MMGRNNMKITYDSEVDVLRILFSNTPIEESEEDKPGVILDYDKDGNVTVENVEEEHSTRNTRLMRMMEDRHIVENRGREARPSASAMTYLPGANPCSP